MHTYLHTYVHILVGLELGYVIQGAGKHRGSGEFDTELRSQQTTNEPG